LKGLQKVDIRFARTKGKKPTASSNTAVWANIYHQRNESGSR